MKTNEIAERPGEVHGLRVRVAARQLGVLDVPHQEQGGAEPADDRSGGGTTSSGALYCPQSFSGGGLYSSGNVLLLIDHDWLL